MAGTLRTDYARASVERLEDSRHLIAASSYPGAIYSAGLAAESMLKAFIYKRAMRSRVTTWKSWRRQQTWRGG